MLLLRCNKIRIADEETECSRVRGSHTFSLFVLLTAYRFLVYLKLGSTLLKIV